MLSPMIFRTLGFACWLFSPLALAQSCRATDHCKIDVQFKGSYRENTCDPVINNGSANETVILPEISTTSLNYSGAEAGSKMFSVTLKNCPINKAISLYFGSTASGAAPTTGNLSNATGNGYSKNVEIRLRKADQQQMVIDDPLSYQQYVVSSTHGVSHQYIASYYAIGSTGATAGLVNTAAAIIVDYK